MRWLISLGAPKAPELGDYPPIGVCPNLVLGQRVIVVVGGF